MEMEWADDSEDTFDDSEPDDTSSDSGDSGGDSGGGDTGGDYGGDHGSDDGADTGGDSASPSEEMAREAFGVPWTDQWGDWTPPQQDWSIFQSLNPELRTAANWQQNSARSDLNAWRDFESENPEVGMAARWQLASPESFWNNTPITVAWTAQQRAQVPLRNAWTAEPPTPSGQRLSLGDQVADAWDRFAKAAEAEIDKPLTKPAVQAYLANQSLRQTVPGLANLEDTLEAGLEAANQIAIIPDTYGMIVRDQARQQQALAALSPAHRDILERGKGGHYRVITNPEYKDARAAYNQKLEELNTLRTESPSEFHGRNTEIYNREVPVPVQLLLGLGDPASLAMDTIPVAGPFMNALPFGLAARDYMQSLALKNLPPPQTSAIPHNPYTRGAPLTPAPPSGQNSATATPPVAGRNYGVPGGEDPFGKLAELVGSDVPPNRYAGYGVTDDQIDRYMQMQPGQRQTFASREQAALQAAKDNEWAKEMARAQMWTGNPAADNKLWVDHWKFNNSYSSYDPLLGRSSGHPESDQRLAAIYAGMPAPQRTPAPGAKDTLRPEDVLSNKAFQQAVHQNGWDADEAAKGVANYVVSELQRTDQKLSAPVLRAEMDRFVQGYMNEMLTREATARAHQELRRQYNAAGIGVGGTLPTAPATGAQPTIPAMPQTLAWPQKQVASLQATQPLQQTLPITPFNGYPGRRRR